MKKQNFIEVNSDKELLKQESYDRIRLQAQHR